MTTAAPAIPNDVFMTSAHPWQQNTIAAFEAGCRRFFQAWHRRARKTTMWTNILVRETALSSNRVYLYVAPTYKQARSIVWNDPNMLFKWLPDKKQVPWEKNETNLSIRFPASNTHLRLVGGDDPDSVRGIDCHGVVYDEWPLCKPEIWFEIIRPIIAQDPDRWAAFIFTPKGMNFAYQMLLDALKDQWNFDDPNGTWYVDILPATQTGLIPVAELEKAKADMPRELFDQEFMCSFITDEEMTCITSRMLEMLKMVHRCDSSVRKIVSIDSATGGDECPVYGMENCEVVASEICHFKDTMKIVATAQIIANQIGTKDIICDEIGIGKGVCDRLVQLGFNVQCFNSGAKSTNPLFANLKAEAWFYARGEVEAGRLPYPEDMELRRQLTAVRYRIQQGTGKIIMVPKDKTKEVLACSPDRADDWVMGVWGSQFVVPEHEKRPVSHVPPRRGQTATVDPMCV